MSDIQTISVLTPCYNEADNVDALYERVKAVFEGLGKYRYEHVFIDNASTDGTTDILRKLAARDRREAPVTLLPIAGRRVQQHHVEPVRTLLGNELLDSVLVGKRELDGAKSGVRGFAEALEERHLVEQERQIRGEPRHDSPSPGCPAGALVTLG